jgi:hypothetical protein
MKLNAVDYGNSCARERCSLWVLSFKERAIGIRLRDVIGVDNML